MRFAFIPIVVMASAVQSGGLPEDFVSYEGRFAFGISDRTPGSDAFLIGDASARLRYGNIGIELGTFGRVDALDTPHETYGAALYYIGDTEIAVGVPRPAYDRFAVSALELSFPSLGIDRVRSTRSAATFGAMFGNWLPYGVSVRKSGTNSSYALSWHHSKAPGESVIGLGFGAELGDWKLSAAVEATGNSVNAKAQLNRVFGKFTGGVTYFAAGSAGNSDVLEVHATVRPKNRFGLTAVVQTLLDGGSATAGVSGHYNISDVASFAVGVASDSGSSAVYSAFLDFRF